MIPKRKFRPTASASYWGEGNEQIPVVRIYGGVGKRGVAVSYTEIDNLIEQLRYLKSQHEEITYFTDRLVIND